VPKVEQWRRNLIVLWVGTVFGGLSFSIVSPFLPTLLKQVGVTSNLEIWSGWAFAATYYTSTFLAPVWGALADKYGRKPQLMRAGFGIGATYLLMAFAASPMQVVLLRLLLGIFNGFIPTAVAMVAVNTPEEHLGTALGTIQTGGAFGSVLGPLVGGFLSHYVGIQSTLLISGFGLFGATLVCVLGTKETTQGDRSIKISVISDIKTAGRNPLLMQMYLLIMVFTLSQMVIQPVLPLFIEQLASGNVEVVTGVIFSIAGIATVLAAPYWGKQGQNSGFTRALKRGFVGATVISFLMALSRNIWTLGASRFAFGLFIAAVMPASNALIAKAVPSGFRSRALSLSNSAQQVGSAIGPIVGGYVGQAFGLPTVFLVTGGLLTLILIWMRNKQWDQAQSQSKSAGLAG
jgi:MFS family permease